MVNTNQGSNRCQFFSLCLLGANALLTWHISKEKLIPAVWVTK